MYGTCAGAGAWVGVGGDGGREAQESGEGGAEEHRGEDGG